MSQLADALQPTLSRAQAPPIFSRGSAWGLGEEAGVQELKFSGTRSVSRDVCDDQHSIRVFFKSVGFAVGKSRISQNYLSSSCRFALQSNRHECQSRNESDPFAAHEVGWSVTVFFVSNSWGGMGLQEGSIFTNCSHIFAVENLKSEVETLPIGDACDYNYMQLSSTW